MLHFVHPVMAYRRDAGMPQGPPNRPAREAGAFATPAGIIMTPEEIRIRKADDDTIARTLGGNLGDCIEAGHADAGTLQLATAYQSWFLNSWTPFMQTGVPSLMNPFSLYGHAQGLVRLEGELEGWRQKIIAQGCTVNAAEPPKACALGPLCFLNPLSTTAALVSAAVFIVAGVVVYRNRHDIAAAIGLAHGRASSGSS